MTVRHHDDVTVVITNYNLGRFLPEAVESVLQQSGGAPRLIVVDDGSTDPHTLQVLEQLDTQEGVEVVRQTNAGVCAARNAGFTLSSTPYVMMLDGDDKLTPDAISVLLPPLAADESLGWTYGHQQLFGQQNAVMRFPPFDPYRLLDRHLIGPTALTRREVFADTGGYDPEFTVFEDWEFWVNAYAHGWTGLRVDAVTRLYRRRDDGKMDTHDRLLYRPFRRQLVAKHRALYERREELAQQSDLAWWHRLVYRYYWGPRPMPARVEQAAYRLYFRGVAA